MCGRFTQAYTWQEVYEFYNLSGAPRNLQPNYNVAPTQMVNVIVCEGGKRILVDMRWGLIPMWWKKPLKDLPSTFNARLETAAEVFIRFAKNPVTWLVVFASVYLVGYLRSGRA